MMEKVNQTLTVIISSDEDLIGEAIEENKVNRFIMVTSLIITCVNLKVLAEKECISFFCAIKVHILYLICSYYCSNIAANIIVPIVQQRF